MGALQLKQELPYQWDNTPEGRLASQNDQKWLNSITTNAAPFSDWWTKARIVQMAYKPMYGADPALYKGLGSAVEITTALFDELHTHCQTLSEDLCDSLYPGFCRQVDENFVVETLNYWKNKQFSRAISRNFEIYRYIEQHKSGQGDRINRNTFLVVSTAAVSLAIPRSLPDPRQFRPLFNVNELAQIIHDHSIRTITLRTHGYANPARGFFKFLTDEANALFNDPDKSAHPYDVLAGNHLYIGYHWPSEFPLFNKGLMQDSISNIEILLKFLISLFILSLIPSSALILLLLLLKTPIAPQWHLVLAAGVYALWLSLYSLLRSVVYQRDRYRAVHYGAPDLAEFFWRLDKQLTRLIVGPLEAKKWDMSPASRQMLDQKRLRVNLIGHSMGGLVLVNTLRVLSDRFGKDDTQGREDGRFGNCLDLGKMILASPDIPLELIREGRNNYVRSALRRCEQIYLMSSDRDVVLRYLSTLGNWFTEPSVEMSGLRLGNLFLPPNAEQLIERKRREKKQDKLKILLVRGAILTRNAVSPTSAYDLFENITYFDCSKMKGVNGTRLDLNIWTAIPIDIINIVLYLTGQIDAHGGYFFTETPTFKLMPFLMQAPAPSEAEIRFQLDRWDPRRRMIRFLYRITPTPGSADAYANSGNNREHGAESVPS